jgi:hypothetical protein
LIGDDRWDTLLAAIAEYLAARLDLAPPSWSRPESSHDGMVPVVFAVKTNGALVWAPAAFRKHGVYLSSRDLEAA